MPHSLTEARDVTLHAGDQPIPGFRLIRRRGRGGFGEVWEAEASGGFLVALKFVRLSSRARAAELRALEFVRGIHHPNLLANFGSWLVDDTLIIGMELADRSLWDRHIEATQQGYRGIPRGELLGYLAEVAAGIDHLNGYRHTFDGRSSVGVQHRDLKPPNILLFGGGAKVADLGMARAMEGEVAGHTGVWTFPYAAPEFFRGETTRQSDQYGLAVTFCQLRGGRLPFGGSAASVTAGHLFARPDLSALPDLEHPIVERALAKVPGERWPSCRAFVDALRDLPADAVADILIDPDGTSAASLEARGSSDPGSPFPDGFLSSGSGAMFSGWQLDAMCTGSTFDPAALAGTGAPASLPPITDDGPARSADFVPTLILPAVPAAAPDPLTPDPSRRPTRYLRPAIAAGIALALAAVATQTSTRDQQSRAAQVAPDLIIAEPDPAAPVVALAAPDAAVESEVSPDREQAPPRPLPIEPIAVAPAPAEVAISPPPAAQDRLPAPSMPPLPIVPDRGALVLEGPVEMAVAAPGATPPATQASVPSVPALPPVIASQAVLAPSRPPEAVANSRIASPPVPTRSIPGPASLGLALANPPPAVDRNPTPARTGTADLAGAEAAFSRGRDFFHQKAFARAAAEFDESIRLNPGHVTSYLVRAIARHRAGDPRAALADYAEVIRARPDDVTAHISRGQAYHELAEYDRAIADYDEAIRRRPGDGEVRFRRGLSRFQAGDNVGSIGDFTETLRLDPANAYAAEFRAEAVARRDARSARDPQLARTSAVEAVRPAASPAAPPGASAVRETSYHAAAPVGPTAAARQAPNPPPAARPAPNPAAPDKRRQPLRRLIPWPLGRPK